MTCSAEVMPGLHDAIAFLFDLSGDTGVPPLQDRREAQTLDYGHVGTREQRLLTTSTDLTRYLAWPGLAQVLRIERTWIEQDQARRAAHYAIASLALARDRDNHPLASDAAICRISVRGQTPTVHTQTARAYLCRNEELRSTGAFVYAVTSETSDMRG
ncbi:MAG: hypothetical protein H0V47_00745 [Chloroflexia bacterium]|nr:hypothetical protein [Chloroflexia bacterium]